MKIISKFSDYYDVGLVYGIDEKLCFVRNEEEIKDNDLYNNTKIFIYKKDLNKYRLRLFFNEIGFCGELYPFIHIYIEKIKILNKKETYSFEKEYFTYNFENFKDFMRTYIYPFDESFMKHLVNYESLWHFDNEVNYIERYFREYVYKESVSKECFYSENLFKKYNTPYYVQAYSIEKKKKVLILKPQLKKYRFMKVLSIMEAFQEISMFLGSLNLGEDKTVQIEDKYLAQGKGFDCHSFRKSPSKRKKKKCKK